MTIKKKNIFEKIEEFRDEIIKISPFLKGKTLEDIYWYFFTEEDYYGPLDASCLIRPRLTNFEKLPLEFQNFLNEE